MEEPLCHAVNQTFITKVHVIRHSTVHVDSM